MARKLGFRKGLRQQQRESIAGQSFYAAMMERGPRRDAALAHIAQQEAQIKPVRERAKPRKLEAPVVAAISDLLEKHPKVLFAVRQNSGMSWNDKAPVSFYRILTHAKDMTLPDFWGIMRDGRLLAIEAKAPGWKRISGERELRQEMFLMLVRNCGGRAGFATSVEEAQRIIEG